MDHPQEFFGALRNVVSFSGLDEPIEGDVTPSVCDPVTAPHLLDNHG